MQQQMQVQQEAQNKEAMIMQELQKQLLAAQSAVTEAQADALITNAQVTQADKMFDNTLNEAELEHKKFVDIEKLRLDGAKIRLDSAKIVGSNN